MRIATAVIALSLLAGALTAAASKSVKPPSNEDCLTCHGETDSKRSNGRSVFVARTKLESSVHGQAGVACVDCHADLAKTQDFPHKPHTKKVECASCHEKAGASHPFHPEIARAESGKEKPQVDCADCHGSHEVTAVVDPSFRFTPARQAQACGTCHEEIRDHFVASEHGMALASGAQPAPSCLSCHKSVMTAGAGIDLAALKSFACPVTSRTRRCESASRPAPASFQPTSKAFTGPLSCAGTRERRRASIATALTMSAAASTPLPSSTR